MQLKPISFFLLLVGLAPSLIALPMEREQSSVPNSFLSRAGADPRTEADARVRDAAAERGMEAGTSGDFQVARGSRLSVGEETSSDDFASENDTADDPSISMHRYLEDAICNNIYTTCLAQVAGMTHGRIPLPQGSNIEESTRIEWEAAKEKATSDIKKRERELDNARRDTELAPAGDLKELKVSFEKLAEARLETANATLYAISVKQSSLSPAAEEALRVAQGSEERVLSISVEAKQVAGQAIKVAFAEAQNRWAAFQEAAIKYESAPQLQNAQAVSMAIKQASEGARNAAALVEPFSRNAAVAARHAARAAENATRIPGWTLNATDAARAAQTAATAANGDPNDLWKEEASWAAGAAESIAGFAKTVKAAQDATDAQAREVASRTSPRVIKKSDSLHVRSNVTVINNYLRDQGNLTRNKTTWKENEAVFKKQKQLLETKSKQLAITKAELAIKTTELAQKRKELEAALQAAASSSETKKAIEEKLAALALQEKAVAQEQEELAQQTAALQATQAGLAQTKKELEERAVKLVEEEQLLVKKYQEAAQQRASEQEILAQEKKQLRKKEQELESAQEVLQEQERNFKVEKLKLRQEQKALKKSHYTETILSLEDQEKLEQQRASLTLREQAAAQAEIAWHAKVVELENQRAALEKEKITLAERNKIFVAIEKELAEQQAALLQLLADSSQAHEKNVAWQQELEEREEKLVQAEANFQDALARANEAEQRAAQAEQRAIGAEEELTSANDKMALSKSERDQLKETCLAEKEKRKILKTETQTLSKKLEEAADQTTVLEQAKLEAEQARASAEEARAALEIERASVVSAHQALADAHEDLQTTHENLNAEYGNLSSEHDTLKTAHENLNTRLNEETQSFQDQLRTQVASASEGHLMSASEIEQLRIELASARERAAAAEQRTIIAEEQAMTAVATTPSKPVHYMTKAMMAAMAENKEALRYWIEAAHYSQQASDYQAKENEVEAAGMYHAANHWRRVVDYAERIAGYYSNVARAAAFKEVKETIHRLNLVTPLTQTVLGTLAQSAKLWTKATEARSSGNPQFIAAQEEAARKAQNIADYYLQSADAREFSQRELAERWAHAASQSEIAAGHHVKAAEATAAEQPERAERWTQAALQAEAAATLGARVMPAAPPEELAIQAVDARTLEKKHVIALWERAALKAEEAGKSYSAVAMMDTRVTTNRQYFNYHPIERIACNNQKSADILAQVTEYALKALDASMLGNQELANQWMLAVSKAEDAITAYSNNHYSSNPLEYRKTHSAAQNARSEINNFVTLAQSATKAVEVRRTGNQKLVDLWSEKDIRDSYGYLNAAEGSLNNAAEYEAKAAAATALGNQEQSDLWSKAAASAQVGFENYKQAQVGVSPPYPILRGMSSSESIIERANSLARLGEEANKKADEFAQAAENFGKPPQHEARAVELTAKAQEYRLKAQAATAAQDEELNYFWTQAAGQAKALAEVYEQTPAYRHGGNAKPFSSWILGQPIKNDTQYGPPISYWIYWADWFLTYAVDHRVKAEEKKQVGENEKANVWKLLSIKSEAVAQYFVHISRNVLGGSYHICFPYTNHSGLHNNHQKAISFLHDCFAKAAGDRIMENNDLACRWMLAIEKAHELVAHYQQVYRRDQRASNDPWDNAFYNVIEQNKKISESLAQSAECRTQAWKAELLGKSGLAGRWLAADEKADLVSMLAKAYYEINEAYNTWAQTAPRNGASQCLPVEVDNSKRNAVQDKRISFISAQSAADSLAKAAEYWTKADEAQTSLEYEAPRPDPWAHAIELLHDLFQKKVQATQASLAERHDEAEHFAQAARAAYQGVKEEITRHI